MRACKSACVAIFASLALLMAATPSEAQWRGRYGGYRGYGAGFYPRGWGWGGYGYGWRPGFNVGLGFGGYGGYRSYYGSYPSYGYGYSGYYPYSYAGVTTAPSYYYSVPAATTYVTPPTSVVVESSAAPRTSAYYDPAVENQARVRVRLPAAAELQVADQRLGQTGSERDFVTPALTPGKSYYYEMTARWTDAGKPVEQTKRVTVRANETTTVEFGPGTSP